MLVLVLLVVVAVVAVGEQSFSLCHADCGRAIVTWVGVLLYNVLGLVCESE